MTVRPSNVHPRPARKRACGNCGFKRLIHAHGRCAACAKFWRLYGHERPAYLIERQPRAGARCECGRPVYASGLCKNHYNAQYRPRVTALIRAGGPP